MDLPVSLELWNGYKDYDGFFSTLNLDLLCSADLVGPELTLELWDVGLELDEGLSQSCFELRWRTCWRICCALNFECDGHDRGRGLVGVRNLEFNGSGCLGPL